MNTRLHTSIRRSILSLLICTLTLPAFWYSHGQDNPKDDKPGLRMRLSEGRPPAEKPATPAATSVAESLPTRVTQAVLARLAAIKQAVVDKQSFALRPRSLPPPRTGQTINKPFPARSQASAPTPSQAGPLEVTRFAPEGEVELAPHLSVTFSQPMVAITSQELASQTVPVKLSPLPPGQWRWVGTQTLLFEPTGRFPMATRYEVEIPAGTRSASGSVLAETKRWTFATPAPEVEDFFPANEAHGTSRNPLFFLEFNQRINPAEALKFISLRSDKGSAWQLCLATTTEIEADWKVRDSVKAVQPNTWLALRAVAPTNVDPDKPLPAATSFTLTIKAGMPSAEGPRVLPEAWSRVFGTYQPLRIIKHTCEPRANTNCAPYGQLHIQFNNGLRSDSFTTDNVRVEPAVPDLKVSGYGSSLNLQGAFRPRATYRVTLKAALKDTFEQTLGQDQTVEFGIGKAELALHVPGGGFVVLDPAGPRSLSVYSINHESLNVRLYAVVPEDYGKYAATMRRRMTYDRNKREEQLPEIGRRVWAETLTLDGQPDEITETRIDLKPALPEGLGHALLIVEPTANVTTPYGQQRSITWIQSTNLALDAFADQTQLLAWTTSLKDGQPVANAQLTLLGETDNPQTLVAATPTAANGLAKLRLPSEVGRKFLIARHGKDTALLPENLYFWGDQSAWKRNELTDELRWHVFDDRGLYRPGEEVHLKGWLRRLSGGPTGDVALLKAATRIRYVVKDGQDNQVAQGTLTANVLGGFDTKFKLPATMNLGFAHVEFTAQGTFPRITDREHRHDFQVQEFRRPEYEVNITASEGPHFVGGHADLTVAANYYAGGGLPNTEVEWVVGSTPTNYTPPNRGDFTFGKRIPWWNESERDNYGEPGEEYNARTDATGKHHLRVDFEALKPARPMLLQVGASVTDVNRQRLNSSTELIVHPATLYVGLRSPRTFVQPNELLVVEAIVTTLDGESVAGREVKVRAVRLDWQFENGRWQEREIDAEEYQFKSAYVTKCQFVPKGGGKYRITATIIDDRERRNESELSLWVAGGQHHKKEGAEKDLAKEKVELIPSQAEYKPGDIAELLMQAPFENAEGLLTVRRAGLVTSERFKVAGMSHTLRIPIKDEYTPNIHVQVDLVGATTRTDEQGQPDPRLPQRPAFASGELKLAIPPVTRKLQVKATPRATMLEPGGTTAVNVEVRDAAGQPVRGGEVAVVVVDEAVLALTRYETPDALKVFYPERGEVVSEQHSRSNVLLKRPAELISKIDAKMIQELPLNTRGMMGLLALSRGVLNADASETVMVTADGPLVTPITTRRNFNPLATFTAALPTDANGRASVIVKLPDNLTRYRVMAVVVAGEKQFGSGEAAITARLPLMVRPSAPRFLNFGDRFELPVVVQNQTDAPLAVDVAARASNAVFVVQPSGGSTANAQSAANPSNATLPPEGWTTNTAGKRVTVPANDRVEVRFPAATVNPGMARFQIAVTSGKWSDAAEIALPVWTPATTEAFATYGELDDGAIAQLVQAPPSEGPNAVFKEFGGLEITTSSTQLQALTDAVLYLTSYPYECTEQISSRILAIAALRDVLAAFQTKDLPTPNELLSTVNRDLKRLEGLQSMGGAFGFWMPPDELEKEWPYLSLHAAHAMARAKAKGFSVPPRMLERSQEYLRDIQDHIPMHYGVEETRVLRAYALYVRHLLDDLDIKAARILLEDAGGVEKLPLEALGWLLPVLANETETVAALHRHLNNRVEETAATAHFTTRYKDGAHLLLHSDRRPDAILLEALIITDAKNTLIPKLARGLLAQRKQGRWESTQENAWVLLALDRYFQTYEKATPNFVARAWLGEQFAGQHVFKGRSTERSQINVPMNWLLARDGAQTLTLGKTGGGRLYYRLGLQYAPRNLELKAADYGFTVTRTYEAIDNPNDVRRQEDGTWRIKAGAQVRVRLMLVAPTRRYHVALVDPLPAGFEALNPALATTGALPPDPQEQPRYWWNPSWYEHQNLRDERVEAFTSLLWEGVYNYAYVARATTPGVFVVPPPKAEEMYHPETFGRGRSERVVIE